MMIGGGHFCTWVSMYVNWLFCLFCSTANMCVVGIVLRNDAKDVIYFCYIGSQKDSMQLQLQKHIY
jgi:hypothetical protein